LSFGFVSDFDIRISDSATRHNYFGDNILQALGGDRLRCRVRQGSQIVFSIGDLRFAIV